MANRACAMRRLNAVLAAASFPLVVAFAAHAEDSGDDRGLFERTVDGIEAAVGINDEDRRQTRRFTEEEREAFQEYYRNRELGAKDNETEKKKSLPPGLKKKVERGGQLPPGWQKKVERGEVLPEDVYRYRAGLPDDLRYRLPEQPEGTETFRVENKAVRIIQDTREIIDILDL